MLFASDDKPIIACSSSVASNSAISLIRISGFEEVKDFQKVFSKDLSNIQSRKVYYCDLIKDEKVIDSIVFTYFKGPNSYNGENILELSVHGNVLNVNRIIKIFIDNFNIRHAKPGEFSYRALKNEKLNLSQIEALDLFLNSKSQYGLDLGNSLMNGSLSKLYNSLYQAYLTHKGSVELGIDFLEDVGEENFKNNLKISLNQLEIIVGELNSRVNVNPSSILNPKIILIGNTNSGKSSLFNNLLKRNRAIVSDIRGTTRDYISEQILVNNTQFELIDTAGLRETNDVIEKQGIESVKELMNDSFYKIHVINPYDDYEKLEDVDLVICTHKDGPIEPKSENGPIGPDLKLGPIEPIKNIYPDKKILFINNLVFDVDYENIIFESIFKKFQVLIQNKPILIPRHKHVISNIYNELKGYNKICLQEEDIAIISAELNIIGHSIEELIGIVTVDKVLNNIFDNFCIGK
jgi:tRNA modification GTPase